jgi:hypothetical protein
MIEFYSKTLNLKPVETKKLIYKLEQRYKKPKHDLNLFSQIQVVLKHKLIDLGLDSSATAEDIIIALNHKIVDVDQQLVRSFQTVAATRVNALAKVNDGLDYVFHEVIKDKQVYAIKNSFFKSYFIENKPKHVLSNLGYRSLNSLLKHEPVSLTILAVNLFESKTYLTKFFKHFLTLQPTDFEIRPIQIVKPHHSHWSQYFDYLERNYFGSAFAAQELATIIMPDLMDYPPVKSTLLKCLTMNKELMKIDYFNSFIKLHLGSHNIGLYVHDYLMGEYELFDPNNKLNLSWNNFHQIAESKGAKLSYGFLESSDFKNNSVMSRLKELSQDLNFFLDTNYVGALLNDQIISFNIRDVLKNSLQKTRQIQLSFDHLSQELYLKMIEPYLTKRDLGQILETANINA